MTRVRMGGGWGGGWGEWKVIQWKELGIGRYYAVQ